MNYKLNLVRKSSNDASALGTVYNGNAKGMPPSVDLRHLGPEVYNQGSLGACTGFSASGLLEVIRRVYGKPSPRLSPMFLYRLERLCERDVVDDAGANIVDALWALLNHGCATEAEWPYIIEYFAEEPSQAAEDESHQHKISSAHHLHSLDDLKHCLADGFPAVFGMCCFSGLNEVGPDGLLALPQSDEDPEGGHAVLAVGYEDEAGVVIIRNSWGSDWGDGGYFYMPYAYFQKYCYDIWTAR